MGASRPGRMALSRGLVLLGMAGLAACATGPPLAQLDRARPRGAARRRRGRGPDLPRRPPRRRRLRRRASGPLRPGSGAARRRSRRGRRARRSGRRGSAFLDYILALDAIGRAHQRFAELEPPDRERSFAIGHAAYVAQYRFALDLLDRLDRNPDLQPQLNEPVPELGLPPGTYTRARVRFLNVVRGTEFAALGMVDEDVKAAAPPALAATIAEDRAAIWRYGAGRGEVLTVTSALQVVQRAAFAGWFPVQAGIAEWMGDDTPRAAGPRAGHVGPGGRAGAGRSSRATSSSSDASGISPTSGSRGSGLTPSSTSGRLRSAVAPSPDPEVAAWVEARGQPNGDFEALLARTHPAAHARAVAPDGDATPRRTLEALSDGVVFTTLEHAAGADHVAALRPRLPVVEKAAALLRAFGYAGRPYDFNFDFRTDAALVCSELVYKAYEPGPGRQGLRLPLVEVLGRPSSRPASSRGCSTPSSARRPRSSTWSASSTAGGGGRGGGGRRRGVPPELAATQVADRGAEQDGAE